MCGWIVVHDGTPVDIFVPIQTTVKAVILGSGFPLGLIPSASYFCNKLNVPLVQLRWHNSKPHLSPPIDSWANK